MQQTQATGKGCSWARLSLLWMNLSSEPLMALFATLPFILRKELGASAFQLALFTTLSPVIAVLSFYWGAHLTYRKNALLPNLISAWVMSRLPFLFFPFIKNFWFFFFAAAIYHFFNRALTPALMEVLKRNIPQKPRERIFSFYFMLSVCEGIGLGLLFTNALNISASNWPLFFFFAALFSISSIFIQMRIPLKEQEEPVSLKPQNRITHPIKVCFELLKNRPDFAHFQWCFMIGGLSLMMIAPVRSIFAASTLSLSLGTVTLARCVFVGIGIAGSSFLWQRGLEKFGIKPMTYLILVGFGLFSFALLLSSFHLSFFFGAHLIYGVAQGGSHLIWHLSGPIFAGEEESSSLYSTVNILMVGLRGMVGPFLGGFLCDVFGPYFVLACGGGLAFIGTWWLKKKSSAPQKQIGNM